MTIYTARDFARAAHRIKVAIERREPGNIGLRHLEAAVAALRLCEEGIHGVEASWPDEAALHRLLRQWHRREHEAGDRHQRPRDDDG